MGTEGTEGTGEAGRASKPGDPSRTGETGDAGKAGGGGEANPGLEVTARILPENRRVYELLVTASQGQGMTPEEVNTTLINVGLVTWVKRISDDLETIERSSDGKGGP